MASSYIPAQDALALAWMLTFSGGISDDVATYQMSEVEAAAIVAAVALFVFLCSVFSVFSVVRSSSKNGRAAGGAGHASPNGMPIIARNFVALSW